MIPPPPPTGTPTALYDTECFPNYWLLKFRPIDGEVFTFSLRAGERFDPPTIQRIARLFAIFLTISFNGNHYDVPMLTAALHGYTAEQLKWLNDQIIVEGRKPWELNLPEWKPANHIDLIEVAPGAGSQKQYAGRIHCKTMRDLPYSPDAPLTPEQMLEVDSYCENDLSVLGDLWTALQPQVRLRESMTKEYGIDLRSKSDAQLGESVIKLLCERALGRRIVKAEIDWGLAFRYEPPVFLTFYSEPMLRAFEAVKSAIFTLGLSGAVGMPAELEGLDIAVGSSVYRLGIGGLHSSEKCVVHISDEMTALREADVVSYYPNLIINSNRWPSALGPEFRPVYIGLKERRVASKHLEKQFKAAGDTSSVGYLDAHNGNEGGKVAINGPFGKLNNFYSTLRAPEMFIQTTLTGQLALLMLIERHEFMGIPVVSANTDGLVIKCPRALLPVSDELIKQWERETGLEMETGEYRAIYSRDINNYFAVKPSGEVKRKGEYSKAGLIEKKNPDVEICSDAVADFLSKGTPILCTLAACRDIRKFVTVQRVSGGAVKLWGEGPHKDARVRDMVPVLTAQGWAKRGRSQWVKGEAVCSAGDAYKTCFSPQRPEYLGKVIRWFYSIEAPGPIIYNTNTNTVGGSYGAKPCMTLPDDLPADIDYAWYLAKCDGILKDIGVTQ
jgi:hypothetical protein